MKHDNYHYFTSRFLCPECLATKFFCNKDEKNFAFFCENCGTRFHGSVREPNKAFNNYAMVHRKRSKYYIYEVIHTNGYERYFTFPGFWWQVCEYHKINPKGVKSWTSIPEKNK